MQHRSPGLTTIYNEIKSSRQNRLLDLGSIVASNFNFLSQLSCKIHYENLDDFIEDYGILSGDNLELRLEKFLLKHDSSQKFDVILAWDLLNYLPLNAVKTLFALLDSVCKPNTLVHAIKYLHGNIPAHPARFQIIDQYHLSIFAEVETPRRVAAHQTAALLKQIPQYYLHNNLMNEEGMASGIAEQVMRFKPDKSIRKQYVSRAEFSETPKATPKYQPQEKTHTASSTLFDEKIYASPSILSLLQRLSYRRTILDCGLKSAHNMDFWRQYFQKVYTEDLPSSLHWRNHANQLQSSSAKPLSSEALDFDIAQRFDLIVLWDIFNYGEHLQISAIGNRLRQYCHEQTKILVMSYAGEKIPEHPQRFQLVNEGYRCLTHSPKARRSVPAITTAGLMKLIPGWIIEKTHVFSPGMKPGIAELIFKNT